MYVLNHTLACRLLLYKRTEKRIAELTSIDPFASMISASVPIDYC
jgi:hypothetical protein